MLKWEIQNIYKTKILSEFMFKLILSPILAWFIAHLIKVILRFKKEKTPSKGIWYKSGGMPSGHSATVSALTLAVYLDQGFTALFTVTLILSIIVLRDTLIRTKETRHAVKEVLAGVILGLIISYLVNII